MLEMTLLYNAYVSGRIEPHKPLAIMVGTLDMAIELVHINDVELDILTGMERPIVLLEKNHNSSVHLSPLCGT